MIHQDTRNRQLAGRALALSLLILCGVADVSRARLPVPRVPESAFAVDAIDAGEPVVEARLLIDAERVRPGDKVWVGVLLDFAPHWHMYWRNPGDSGLATEVDWEVDGGRVGAPAWPAPKVFREADDFSTTFGWDDQVLLMVPMWVDPDQNHDGVLAVQVDGVACKIRCIPARLTLERPIPIGPTTEAASPRTRALFRHALARVPRDPASLGIRVEALYSQSAVRPGDSFDAGIVVTSCEEGSADCFRASMPAASETTFVADETPTLNLQVGVLSEHPDAAESPAGFVVQFAGRAEEDEDPGTHQRLRGILGVGPGSEGEPVYVEVDLPLPRARAGDSVASLPALWLAAHPEARAIAPGKGLALPSSGAGLLEILLLALLGGLILNAMPCVLPVLAIKVFSVAELAEQSSGEALRHGLAYTAGTVLSMLALAGVVTAVRVAGIELGWGFQFQEPLFVAVIGAVLVAFALNLFGVFEISVDTARVAQLGATRSGPGRSFFDGLLAVVLSTPCSAPFLGTAVGFAFASPPGVIFVVFAAIGIGLAAPYLLVTAVPGWGRLLPKPGPWMQNLRAVLGFALLATVIWLVWVMSRSVGEGAQVALLAFLLFVGFLAWLYGRCQQSENTTLRRVVGGLSLAASLVMLALLPLDGAAGPKTQSEPAGGKAGALESSKYDAQDVQAQLGQGRAVFAYFTADWCITCKVNENFVLSDDRVRDAMTSLDIAVFRADWTRRDEAIRAELARFGKAGVPVYVVYSPDRPDDPQVLSELLTVETLLEHLRAAAS